MNKNLKKYMFLSMIGLGALACESKLGEDIQPTVEAEMPVTNELFISEYACSSTKDTKGFRNTYFELYNNTGKDIDLSKYSIAYRSNSNPWTDEQALTGVLKNGEVFVIARGGDGVDPAFIEADMVWDALTANGDDAIRLSKEGTAIDFIGETADPGTAWAVAGIDGATKDLVLWRKQAILEGTTDWATAAGTTTENSQWVVSSVKEAYENVGKATADTTKYEAAVEEKVFITDPIVGFDLHALGYAYVDSSARSTTPTYYLYPSELASEDSLDIAKNSAAANGDILSPEKLTSFEELKYFTGLVSFKATSNEITALDFSQNVNLKSIEINYNFIPTLDLQNLTALEVLSYKGSSNAPEGTKLTSIDLSKNTALISIVLASHELTALDLSKNKALKTLDVEKNKNTIAIDPAIFDQLEEVKGAERGEETIIEDDLFISEYACSTTETEAGFRNTYFEIFNNTGAAVNLADYSISYRSNSSDWTEEVALTGTLENGQVYIVGRPEVDPAIVTLHFTWDILKANGDDAIRLSKNGVAIDFVGETTRPEAPWSVAGIAEATANKVIWRKNTITKGNTDWATSAGTTAENSEWIVSNIKEDYANAGKATGDYVAQPSPEEPETPETPAPTEAGLFISEFACASQADANGFRNTYIELYNPTAEAIDLTKYSMKYAKNGANWAYELPLTGTLAADETYLIVREGVNTDIFISDIVWEDLKPSGDDGVQLLKEGVVLDQVGDATDLATDGFTVAGIENATVSRVLWRKATINKGNSDWATSAGTTAEDSEWIVSETKEQYDNVGLPTAN